MNHDDIDLTGSKVLVVDDTPANMDVLRGILEEQGYRIFAAPSGEVALKIAPRTLPDIILLDVMMPGIDGLETCRMLKKDPVTKDIPIIFVSAKTDIQDIIDGFKVGAVDYINKPIRREEVLVRVHTHLEIVALFKAQEKLSQVLAQKNAELIETQQQLVQSEKMASLGTLTAGVAHEINNPNNFVNVSAQNLAFDVKQLNKFIVALAGDKADEVVLASFREQFTPLYRHVSTIKEGSDRIKNIVQDLRAFSQLDSFSKKIVDVGECLQSTVNLVKTNFLKVAVFDCRFGTDISLFCYPAQLNQVFINLIINACDAIRLKQQQQLLAKESEIVLGKVIISCNKKENNMIITVTDNGCGMDEITKNKLYEPFYTTKDVGEGSGLGLSISYGIVQKHNGELKVESVLGEGSCFTLTLPFEE
ncbi:MAG: hybrid sensor histidine kinase/response regulator [Algicola sp.]|nr:hybrid sensor histidine kinase/response regulator [Algicola sp.]